VAWCRLRGIQPIHVANEHVRNAKQAAIAIREGMQPGVSDLLILERCPAAPGVRGVALELKTPKKKASKTQSAWIDRMRGHGWECHVIRSKQEAVDVLTELGFGRV
jgi:hypothetical protein